MSRPPGPLPSDEADPMTTATAAMFLEQRDAALRRVASMHEALRKESARSEQAFRERDATREAGKQLDGAIVRLSDENQRLREELAEIRAATLREVSAWLEERIPRNRYTAGGMDTWKALDYAANLLAARFNDPKETAR